MTLEIRDGAGALVQKLTSREREPTGSSEYLEEEKEALAGLKVPKGKGLQRAVWDLRWAGAEMIPGGKLDNGFPLFGPPALPGTYTVRLTADGESAEAPLTVLPDPRAQAAPGDAEAQLRTALAVRDEITRLTRTVGRLRAVRGQLAARNDLLADEPRAAGLRQSSQALLGKLDALEKRLHNPEAEVIYDILAARDGGAQLYSRLSPLLDWTGGGGGAPTQGVREVLAAHKAELDGCEAELRQLIDRDLAAANETARGLGLPVVYVPPATPAAAGAGR